MQRVGQMSLILPSLPKSIGGKVSRSHAACHPPAEKGAGKKCLAGRCIGPLLGGLTGTDSDLSEYPSARAQRFNLYGSGWKARVVLSAEVAKELQTRTGRSPLTDDLGDHRPVDLQSCLGKRRHSEARYPRQGWAIYSAPTSIGREFPPKHSRQAA